MIEIKAESKMVERAFLIGLHRPQDSVFETRSLLEELTELVQTLGIAVARREMVRLREPHSKFLLGSGKAAEMIRQAKQSRCDCIVFDEPLSPAQQRNWEKSSGMCVIDRQEVILDIFGMRARTREATLQVELARAEYSLPRLKNAWSHLSRQRGGGGVTQRGEGEAQIELDQRMVRHRIARLREELDAVVRQRATQRKQRLRVPLPTAAIVGYTNAGKSTLLTRLSGTEVYAADKLFATLDPTTRQVDLPSRQKILVTDTVGFVRRLPHRLIEAFKATLEEAVVADVLIHVLDATNPEMDTHRETTLGVLKELGAENKRILTVYNKIDLLPEEERQAFSLWRRDKGICLSAETGEGIDDLLQRLEEFLQEGQNTHELLIPHKHYGIVSRLHTLGAVKSEKATEAGICVVANVPPKLQALVAPFLVNGKNLPTKANSEREPEASPEAVGQNSTPGR
jgi:GTPase